MLPALRRRTARTARRCTPSAPARRSSCAYEELSISAISRRLGAAAPRAVAGQLQDTKTLPKESLATTIVRVERKFVEAGETKCLTIVDAFTRECLAIDVAGSIRSERVIDVLPQLTNRSRRSLATCAPTIGRSWPEFVGRAVLEWLQAKWIHERWRTSSHSCSS
jgi:hypothetical protein